MRFLVTPLLLTLVAAAPSSTAAQGVAHQWQQVWADEFSDPGAPDPQKWGYELGQLRNNEAQYYTDRSDNVRVENGMLVIEARKEPYAGAQYTSASIHTLSNDRKTVKFSTTGGRLEVRAKLPSMSGSWPAFWTLGVDTWTPTGGWPQSGEIDVFEYVAHSPYAVFGNLHYQGADGQHKDSVAAYDPRSTHPDASPIHADFHTFRVDWYADRIEWYVDDVKYHHVALDPLQMTSNPFAKPHYLILNLAVGGNWGSPIDPNFTSQQFLVDYVRVSHLVDIPEPHTACIIGSLCIGLLPRPPRRRTTSSTSCSSKRCQEPL